MDIQTTINTEWISPQVVSVDTQIHSYDKDYINDDSCQFYQFFSFRRTIVSSRLELPVSGDWGLPTFLWSLTVMGTELMMILVQCTHLLLMNYWQGIIIKLAFKIIRPIFQ